MYDGIEKCLGSDVNMAAIVRSLVVTCVIFSVCSCSPTTELLETVSRLLIDCLRFYPHADLNMAENLIVRLQVVVDSVRGLVESLDRDDEANADRISQLESVVRQLLNRWEMLARRASSCTALRPIWSLPGVSANNRLGCPAYEISIHQLEFLGNRMRFNWPQISGMLLVSRTTRWRIIRNVESFSSRCHFTTISNCDLDE